MKNDTSNARMQFLMASTGSVFTKEDYQALSNQIEVHKYLINQRIPWTISWDEAAFSWTENVFHSIMQVIDNWEVRLAFSDKTESELYFEISNHWYYLLEKNSQVTAYYAAVDYAATYGKGLGKFVSKMLLPRNVA